VTTPANVLVVDDTVENLRLIASMLGQQGYEVRPVTNGRQALLAVERDPPDLILLDINMPGMNGYEVCAHLKQQEALKDVPVIFLTALSDVADKIRAFEAGGVDYITKPFRMEEVHARVRTHLALRQSARELERSYARLRELEQLRDDLVHMIVHDMRSPLMVVRGHLELLRKGGVGKLSAEAEQDLRGALEAADHLKGMANELLDVSRLEEGKLPVVPEPNDLVSLVSEVTSRIGVIDRERVIHVKAPQTLLVACDGRLVRRVVENLVGNAIKHTPAGGAIHVAISSVDTCARVTISDQGPGIPSEARRRIFEKFGAVADMREGKYHSSGLGLAFCKLAVEAHGGRIGVEPRKPRGSMFWFELERARAGAERE
jgi:signal transduction histidine kinase